jgi:hypothetical protein
MDFLDIINNFVGKLTGKKPTDPRLRDAKPNIIGDPSQIKVIDKGDTLTSKTSMDQDKPFLDKGLEKTGPNSWRVPTPQGEMPVPTQRPLQAPVEYAPEPQPVPNTPLTQHPQGTWTAKYQPLWDSALDKRGVKDKSAIKLIVQSENGAENPGHVNDNGDGTVDVGLGQVNVNKNDSAEIERLKNPEYNVQRAADIWKSRLDHLEDPVLALGSYNLGAGGAVLQPEKALARAKMLYAHSDIPMPQTEFTQNPLGFVRARMNKYKALGLFKS